MAKRKNELRMKDYLFFLGSGASVPFGLPTMRQLAIDFEQTLEKNSPTQIKYHTIKSILELAYGYVDIESIFSVIDMIARDVRYIDYGFASAHRFFAVGISRPEEKASYTSEVEIAKGLTKLMKEYVRARCQLNDSENVDTKINLLYGKVFEALCTKYNLQKVAQNGESTFFDPRCQIYTTNYDLAVETYFQGMTYINDLCKDELNIKTLDVEKYDEGHTTLIKLHGSLNWFQLEDGRIVNLGSMKKRFGNQNIKGEVMLYPIRQKDLYLYPWFNLIYRLKKDLAVTKIWIISGYSFNDEFIRNIFTEEINTADHKMLIIDPDAKGIVNRHFSSNGHVVAIEGKFEDEDITSKLLQYL